VADHRLGPRESGLPPAGQHSQQCRCGAEWKWISAKARGRAQVPTTTTITLLSAFSVASRGAGAISHESHGLGMVVVLVHACRNPRNGAARCDGRVKRREDGANRLIAQRDAPQSRDLSPLLLSIWSCSVYAALHHLPMIPCSSGNQLPACPLQCLL
jgi:hypothetical protein